MPDRRPARPALRVPTHWTPDQADSVFLFLHQIVDAIWEAYEPALVELARRDLRPEGDADPAMSADANDPIPF